MDLPVNVRPQLSWCGFGTEPAEESFAFDFQSRVEFDDRRRSEVLGDELALLPPALAVRETDEGRAPVHPKVKFQ